MISLDKSPNGVHVVLEAIRMDSEKVVEVV